ncbi:family 43 glycosylhydrolase [candidate division KSB1 bacterium]|nr:family 43 glycosylhydrolase [candidate division KSB1 bacterium]
MQTIPKFQPLVLGMLLCSMVFSQPAQNPKTFCNPLNLNYRFMVDAVDAREAADPVMVLFKGDYYLFASRSGGYWTSPDLRNWELIVPTGLDVETYAPGVIAMRDSLFYIPSANGQIYKTGDPKSGVWQEGPRANPYGDPAFFLDDDGRLYMCFGLSNVNPTSIVELDPMTFKEKGSRVNIVYAQASIHGWERRGDDNLLDEQPWIEGTWMIKDNNKYYYHYSGPGTEWKTYADGIYVADSPMGPYEYATYSPFSFKPTGFISGAGHGSTFKDKDGRYWRIVTMTISIKHMFERRLGLYPVAFDDDGVIRCNTAFADYPQYFPGVKENHIDENYTGMMLLSYKKYAMASSSLDGYGVELTVDEDARTYWTASSGDSDEWLILDLGKECSVQAIQVNFGEHNTVPAQVRGRDKVLYEQYTIQKSTDGMNWEMLVDKSQNMQDVPHDYIELQQPVTTRYIKLSNVFTPGGGNFAVRDLRIFGNTEQAVFTDVNGFTVERNPADGRDAVIRWSPVENADGYIVHYGISPDKLYNNYMVYGADSLAMHSLNHGVEYYFRVQAFDSGTDAYRPVGEFRSSNSGNWNNIITWEQYDGSAWVYPAPNVPSPADGNITIRDGHVVTVTEDISADQVTVAAGGTLVINKDVTFELKDGIGTDLMVTGTVRNFGKIESDSPATLTFSNNGRYEHEQDGGSIPTASWKPSSVCVIDSVRGSAPSNGNQNFYDIIWDCPNQSANLNMGWNGNTIGGNIVINNTGSGRWQMCAPSTGTAVTVTIMGNISQFDGQFSSNGTGNANTTISINQYGNIDVTGGNFSVSRGSQGGSGTTAWNLYGNVSLMNATTQNSNPTGATFVFSKDGGEQILAFDGVSFGGGGFPVKVDSGATLDVGTSVLQGNGDFELKAGSTLVTGHPDGINGSIANTGSKIFDNTASYVFSGSTAQVTGSLMPDAVHNFVLKNSQGVTLSNSLVVNGTLEIEDGALALGGNELVYGVNASLKYSGTSNQTTTDVEFPASGGPANLINANTRKLVLHASRTIKNLDLASKMEIGPHTLTAGSISGAGSRAFVVTDDGGALKMKSVGDSQVLFPVGTTTYAPVWIANYGTIGEIGVSVVKDLDDAAFGGRVRVRWNMSKDTPDDGEYTLQFGWTGSLETTDFRMNRENSARLYNLTDTTEVGTGDYTLEYVDQLYTLSRGGIKNLGPFSIGLFRNPTGVSQTTDGIPREFSLSQNYPNPFNPSTTIRYTLARDSKVKILVYDLLGKQVAILVDTELRAGDHSVEWNAKNLASGIYLYKLITREFTQVRKMTLLK